MNTAMDLDSLRKDCARKQKKGLPFMMASVVIWTMIFGVQFLNKDITTLNFYTFMCSCFLMPLAFRFSKLLGADIFKKTDNPINKLGFLCTLNQMLYLLIVMWAYSKNPEAMVMLYAMVFGAHLLPYGWVYDNKTYMAAAVLETLGSLLIACVWGNLVMIPFMIVVQVVLCVILYIDTKQNCNV